MGLLFAGILAWSIVHLYTAVGARHRERLIERMGRGPYRGAYSLLIVLSIVLMVAGWRGSEPVLAYRTPAALHPATSVLMLLALALFFSSRVPTDIKRFLRHPQLTGVIVWAFAHLLSNGDTRSLLLFGGLSVWAIAEIVAINRRDGAWVKPAPVGALRSALPLAIGGGAWFVLAFAHPWIAGVPVIVRG